MIIFFLIAVALGLFYSILQLQIPGLWKFLLVVAEMLMVNYIFIKKYKQQSEMGLVLLKSKKGLALIENLAKYDKAFKFIADVGASMSYGVLSFFIMRKNFSPLTFIIGIILLFGISIFVAPFALAFLVQVVNVGSTSKAAVDIGTSADVAFYMVSGMLLVGGLFLFILFGITFYGLTVLKALITTIAFGSGAISQTAAGGTLLLPGVNLPFFEGIAALAIVMVVHEGAHAILAKIAKVPILSSGIVLFGIIPIGAFVEPDEQKLAKSDNESHTRVLVAGPTANLITSIVFFMLFVSFFFLTPAYREQGLLVRSGMEMGTVIYGFNGETLDLNNIKIDLPKNSEVSIMTNMGEIVRKTDENGKIGITYTVLTKESIATKYSVPGFDFIYTVLGLGLALNFVVGAVNLLPIPLFDGYRLIDVNLKNKMIVKAVSYGALGMFILNFLPLLFH